MARYRFFIGFLIILASCTFTQKVRTGMQAYEIKQYYLASQLFRQEYDASSTKEVKAQLAYYAGQSNEQLLDEKQASEWFRLAYDNGFGDEALLQYAESLKRQERYTEAIEVYTRLLEINPGNTGYRAALTACRQALEWSRQPASDIEVVKADFNTSASEYAPFILPDGKVVFTSDRDSKHSTDTYLWTGRAFADLYVKDPAGSTITEFDSRLNSSDNDGVLAMSPDGNTLILTRCYVQEAYDAWCKLMISYKRNGVWTTPEPLPFVQDKINYGHPAFAANGTTLFFTSDLASGSGGHDLYITQLDAQGAWSSPSNLGSMVNSSYNEMYPTVDGDTLYFSSDKPTGLGGMDIYKTYLNSDLQWVPPLNVKAPVNSGADDFSLVFNPNPQKSGAARTGYLSSNRGGVASMDDIYHYTQWIPATPEAREDTIPDVTETPVVKVSEIYLSLRVMEPVYSDPNDPNSKQNGQRPLPNGPVIVSEKLTDQRFVTDELGTLILKLEWNKDYVFTARYRDHLSSKFELNTSMDEIKPDKPVVTINKTVVLEPIFKNKEIVLENIFYDYDQWAIREDAKPSLNHLSGILKTNPAIRIQLSSHTDCRGTAEYNQELSQKRAQSAVEYLKSTGIPPQRMVAVGMGESSPAVLCDCDQCTEDQHQSNRRTTFKIID